MTMNECYIRSSEKNYDKKMAKRSVITLIF